MNDDGILSATIAGVVVAGIFGLSGLIVGIIGLVQAKNARSTAAEANLIAKDANGFARNANTFAAEANSISRDANALAEEANSITKGQAVKSAEVHRFDWECRWASPGVYRVKNLGPDDVHDVHAQVTVDDEIVEARAERLSRGEYVDLDFPTARAVWEHEKAIKREREARNQRNRDAIRNRGMGLEPILHDFANPLESLNHVIRDLITWTSPMGNPHRHDETGTLASLD